VFAAGVKRLLDNVLATLTRSRPCNSGARCCSGGRRQSSCRGHAPHLDGNLTLGGYFTYTMFLGFLIAPIFQIVAIGTQLTESFAGLERTREVFAERAEDNDPNRTVTMGTLQGDIAFEGVDFAYEADKPVLKDVSFVSPRARSPRSWARAARARDDHRLDRRVPYAERRAGAGGRRGPVRGAARDLRTQLGVVLQDTFLFGGTVRENVAFSRPSASEASRRGLSHRPRERVRRPLPGQARHGRGRARREAVGRAAPAREHARARFSPTRAS